MVYRWLSEFVVAVHFLFVAFVALGALLTVKWPRLAWLHVPVVVWAAAIVSIGFTCPLTPLEKHLRRRAGDATYEGGFVDHYLRDVIYPGAYTNHARAAVALAIIGGYMMIILRRRRDRVQARSDVRHPVMRSPRAGRRRADRPRHGAGAGMSQGSGR